MSRPVFLDRTLTETAAGVRPGDIVPVSPAAARHIRVTRIRRDEEFELVDGAGLRLRVLLDARRPPAAVREEAAEAATGVVVTGLTREPPGRPELVLVQALAKGDRDQQAIEAATEIGVDRVIPWQAARSIAQWPARKKEKAAAKWRSLLDAATQQSRRALAPALEAVARGNAVTGRLETGDLVLVLHEEAARHLADLLDTEMRARLSGDSPSGTPAPARIVLVVGPEGGISTEEVAAFTAAGARTALLGPTVLRASSAGPAGLVLVQAALGRWRDVPHRNSA